MTRLLLSPTEQAYVNGTRDFSKAQQRYLGYRIKKKFSRLGVAAASECRDAAAASRDGPNGLVAQPGRALAWDDVNEIEKRKEALGGNSSGFNHIWTPDLYLTKVTLYQAELPRQLNEQSSQ